jgi:hypothetical protein
MLCDLALSLGSEAKYRCSVRNVLKSYSKCDDIVSWRKANHYMRPADGRASNRVKVSVLG